MDPPCGLVTPVKRTTLRALTGQPPPSISYSSGLGECTATWPWTPAAFGGSPGIVELQVLRNRFKFQFVLMGCCLS